MRSGRKGYKMMTLDGLKTGQSGKILQVNGQGALRHHLLDMGLTPGTVVTLRKVAPMGDPVQIELRGYELTLRLDEAQKMEIEEIQKDGKSMDMGNRMFIVPLHIRELGNLERRRITGKTRSGR